MLEKWFHIKRKLKQKKFKFYSIVKEVYEEKIEFVEMTGKAEDWLKTIF